MQKEIEKLIISISGSLKEYTEGRLAFNEANDAYKKLSAKYSDIADKHSMTGTKNQVEGICYYHNIENFSILSALYGIDKNDTYEFCTYGDNNLSHKTVRMIFDHFQKGVNIEDNKLFIIPPDEKNDFLYSIYVYPLADDGELKEIFAAVSSSTFFSKDKFLFIGKLFKNILSLLPAESRLIEIDYFPVISSEIEKFLEDNIDERHSVQIILYVFNMLDTIFNHMGSHTLFEASDEILKILKDNNRHNSRSFMLSPRDYLVVKRANKSDLMKDGKSKLSFMYKNMNLPYHSLKLNMDKNDSIYSLWDQIMTFENYLATGDIAK